MRYGLPRIRKPAIRSLKCAHFEFDLDDVCCYPREVKQNDGGRAVFLKRGFVAAVD